MAGAEAGVAAEEAAVAAQAAAGEVAQAVDSEAALRAVRNRAYYLHEFTILWKD